jgi:hypothetical protein
LPRHGQEELLRWAAPLAYPVVARMVEANYPNNPLPLLEPGNMPKAVPSSD